MMDLVVGAAMLADGSGPVDVGIAAGRIAAVAPALEADAPAIPVEGFARPRPSLHLPDAGMGPHR